MCTGISKFGCQFGVAIKVAFNGAPVSVNAQNPSTEPCTNILFYHVFVGRIINDRHRLFFHCLQTEKKRDSNPTTEKTPLKVCCIIAWFFLMQEHFYQF